MIHIIEVGDVGHHDCPALCGLTVELQENGDTFPPHEHDFGLYPDGATCPACLAKASQPAPAGETSSEPHRDNDPE